jgi:uncharacterized Zn finger protein
MNNNINEQEKFLEDLIKEENAENSAHCTKCGDVVQGDENSLCGACIFS